MKYKKFILFLFIFGTCLNVINGQTFKERLQETKKYEEIVDLIKATFKDKAPNEKVPGVGKLKHWKRWAWENRFRLDQSGNVENIQPYINRAVKERQLMEGLGSFSRGVNNIWSPLGPSSYTNIDPDGLPGIGRVNKIAFHPTDPSTYYIGSPKGGLWKTTNLGNSWTCLTDNIPNQSISGIVINPSNPNLIFILTGTWGENFNYTFSSSGIFRSADGGNTWTNLNAGLPTANYIGYDLKQHPTNANILYAATNLGLYRSNNGGFNWTRVLSGATFDIEFKPGSNTEMYAAGTQFNSNNAVYWSTNQGSSFTRANTNFPLTNDRIELAVTPADPNYVYMISGPGSNSTTAPFTFQGLFRSTDSGRNFIRRTNSPNILGIGFNGNFPGDQSTYDLCIAASMTNRNVVYTGGLNVWKSEDGGLNMERITDYNLSWNDQGYIHPDIQDLAINPLNNFLFAGTDGGIYYSLNQGDSFINKSATYAATQFYHMSEFNIDNNRLVGGSQDNGLFARNTFGDFVHYSCCDGFESAVSANDQYIYSNANEWINRYHTGTFQGVPVNVDSPYYADFFKQLEAHPFRVNELYVGSTDLLFSNNYGNSYSVLGFDANYDVHMGPSNGNRIYMAGIDNGPISLTRSDDNGATGIPIPLSSNSASFGLPISNITVNPINSNQVYVALGGMVDSLKVFHSTNAGTTWNNITDDMPNLPVLCLDVTTDGKIFVGTDIGVFYRDINFPGWVPLVNNFPTVPVTDVIVNESVNKVRVSTYGRGMFEMDLPDGTCDYVNKIITETLSGYQLFIASNIITHQGYIHGDDENKIYMMAGNYIEFKAGAEAKLNAFVNAKIGNCNSFPLRRSDNNQDDLSESSNKFDYGYIDHLNQDGNSLKLKMKIFQKGKYGLMMTDVEGNSIEVFIKDKQFDKGIYEIEVDLKNLKQEFAYLHLLHKDKHCHFQEINKKLDF